MTKGRKRPPTAEELALWELVAETVAPLEKKRPVPPKKVVPPPEPPKTKKKPLPPAPPLPPPPKRVVPKPPPALSPMDRRARSRLSRGVVTIDRRIDLHGETQAGAERVLDRFLRGAQENGAKVVLVITGKGKATDGGRGERGVLRRMVPMWLSAPHLRAVVVGFEEAAQNHGGAGALYVRIRRQRD